MKSDDEIITLTLTVRLIKFMIYLLSNCPRDKLSQNNKEELYHLLERLKEAIN